MKILFAFYPLFIRYNHGIALLSAICKEQGIDTRLCILGSDLDFVLDIEQEQPNVVGFSCVTVHDYKACLPYIRMAKALGKMVILGGVWAGLGQPVDPAVDYVCRGDGELLPDFLLGGDRAVFESPQVCRDLNALPLPDYALFRSEPFDRGLDFLSGKKVLPYYSSRGCNGSCTFCQIQHQPKGVRIRSKVKEDLTYLQNRYRPDLFFFGDAGLPYGSAAWRESWEDYSHPFCAYIRADIQPKHLHWLIERGMRGCAFGVESANETYRNEVLRKHLSDTDLWRTLGILSDCGVEMVSFFMDGTPGETPEMQAETHALAQAMPGTAFVFRYEELEAVQ